MNRTGIAHDKTPAAAGSSPDASAGTKILICGASGSGKTTLARELSGLFGLDLISLDRLRLLPFWQFASASEVRRRVTAALEDSAGAWVADDEGGANSD